MIQRSFSSGEVDPALYGRADVERWKAALKKCFNWVVYPEGGISVRQGFELKARIAYTSADDIRLIPFEFGPDDSYVEVFHDSQVNLIEDGALVMGDPVYDFSLDKGVTPWRLTRITYNHGYSTGDTVKLFTGTAAGTSYTVTYVSPTVVSLDTTVATSGVETVRARRTALVSGSPGMAVYYWPSAYPMDTARRVQSGDVQYFASGDRAPISFTRQLYAGVDRALSFEVGIINGYPAISNVGVPTLSGTAGTDQLRYMVTYTNAAGEESAVLHSAVANSASISGTTTLTITVVGHGLQTNDTVRVAATFNDNTGSLIYKEGDLVRVVRTGADTFTIPGATSGASASSSTFYYYKIAGTALLTQPATATPITISWSSVVGAGFYNVFREFGRVYGYIGSTSNTSFTDPGIIPDQKDTPVVGLSPFAGSEFPQAIGLFQQRLMFGGFTTDVERIVGSHVGNYMTYDPGAEDASGIDFILAGRSVSGVEHMLEIAGRAVVLTNTSEWVLRGGTSGSLTPSAIGARADSYYGCSGIEPSLIGTSLIYVQRGDRIIRDAKYDFAQEALASADLTLWAKHLFIPEVKRLAYQRTAQILWVLRKDGKLLGLTYVPEQNIWGWHQHAIDGRNIHDICVVSEAGVDRLYCACLKDSYIEIGRLPLVWESGVVDDHAGFDMCLFYDGDLATTGTLTGGTTWFTTETLTLNAADSVFVVGDVGKVFLLKLGDDSVYVTCTAYTSGTEVSCKALNLVPVALRGVASESLARCASTFSGLNHLEGETVGIIGDGSREANATVSSGVVTTTHAFARCQVGIPITADAQALDLEPDDKDTYLGDFKHVTRVYLRVRDTRGLMVGMDTNHLNPFMPKYTGLINSPPALQSGAVEILMDAVHEDSGSVIMRQSEGLPSTVLNMRPVFNAGEIK